MTGKLIPIYSIIRILPALVGCGHVRSGWSAEPPRNYFMLPGRLFVAKRPVAYAILSRDGVMEEE